MRIASDFMISFLKYLLVFSSILCFGMAFFFEELLFKALFALAGFDLASTAFFNKPIIKPGPIAKFLYGKEIGEEDS